MATFSKPAQVPLWATNAGTRTDPGAGFAADGWVGPARPPDEYFNWLDGLQSDHIAWLDERMQDGANNDIFELIGASGGAPYLRHNSVGGDFELLYTGSGFPFLDHSGVTTRLLDVQGVADNPWLEYVGAPQRITISSPTGGPGTNRHLEFLGSGDTTFYNSTTNTAWFSYTAGTGLASFPGNLDVAGATTTVGITASGNVVPAATLTHNLGGSTGRWSELWAGRSILTDNVVTPASQAELASRHANNLLHTRVTATIATTGTAQTVLSGCNILSVERDGGLAGRYIINLDQPISGNCTLTANLSQAGGPANFTINPRQISSTLIEVRISDADTGTPTYIAGEIYVTAIGPVATIP